MPLIRSELKWYSVKWYSGISGLDFLQKLLKRGVESIGGGSEDILVCVDLDTSQNTERSIIFGKQRTPFPVLRFRMYIRV